MGLACADTRLAYVQHPFPAQGQTTDTAHLIIGEHATREGSYVALSRAREQTHSYSANSADEASGSDRLQILSERMSRTEPDLPSIHTPVAHETGVTPELTRASIDPRPASAAAQFTQERNTTTAPKLLERATPAQPTATADVKEPAGTRTRFPKQLEPDPENLPEPQPATDQAGGEKLYQQSRTWPGDTRRDLSTPEPTNYRSDENHGYHWEP